MDGEERFTAFVALRGQALLRTAFLLTGDAGAAEDLLQTALMNAARRWERIESNPEGYVRRTLYHQSVSRWRRPRLREVSWQVAESGGVDRPARSVDDDLRLSLQAALAQLAPRQRAVIVLRYYEDLTEAQTAAMLGIAVGTVKSTARDALRRLRTIAPDLAPTDLDRTDPDRTDPVASSLVGAHQEGSGHDD